MILTTTPSIENRSIASYLGIVTGEAIVGANIFRDLFANIRDIVGGRSAAYEQELERGRQIPAGVERSVKCHRQRPGGFDQLRRPILCDLLGRGERTSHNPLRSCRFCCLNLLLHCAMLAWLVNEIPDTRSHKHENRNGQVR